ncbi:MAG TPA: protein-glutamate O-methyltransferase CheR, partial [Luteolibacter sp.]
MQIAEIEILLKKAIGLDSESVGTAAIERAVQQRLTATGIRNPADYLEKVQSSATELQELIEGVVVSETWFFRDPEAFAVVAENVLQQWLPKRGEGDLLRILSIPCATGEEPYTIAMALDGVGLPTDEYHIDAVDVSEHALARARKAIYGRNSFRGRNLEFRDVYFDAHPHGYQLKERIRRRVLFQRENLFGPDFFPGSNLFHFIFCRNLLIYFDQEAQARAIRTLKRLLTPDGLLFVGPAEAALLLNHEMASIKRPLAFGFRKCASAPRNIPSVAKQVVRKQKPSLTALPPKAPSPKFHAKSQRVSLSHPPANSPGRTAADLSRVRELADKGQLAEAAKLCQRWIEDNPPSAEAFHLLGVIH